MYSLAHKEHPVTKTEINSQPLPDGLHPPPPDWPRDLAGARREQQRLAGLVSLADRPDPITTVAGVDVHYRGGVARAGAVLFSFPELELLATASAATEMPFPYVPGFLSFREVPAAWAALKALPLPPGLLLCDGQGIAHPRGMGLATHLGVLTGLPSIGVAKSRLVGEYEMPRDLAEAWEPLFYRDHVVGRGAAHPPGGQADFRLPRARPQPALGHRAHPGLLRRLPPAPTPARGAPVGQVPLNQNALAQMPS